MTLVGAYSVLFAAIALGVAGTSALLASQHLTRPGSSALAVVCYGVSLVLISITFLTAPMGIVYAVWSGVGIVLVVAVGWIAFGQRLNQPALIGAALIVAGVTVLNLFSGPAIGG